MPIYKSDLGKNLPNKAIVAGKGEDEWIVVDESFTFIFSLFMDDLVKVQKGETIYFGYYKGSDRSTAAITIEAHDRCWKQRSIGVKSQDAIIKYQVGLLGDYVEIKEEKRFIFNIY